MSPLIRAAALAPAVWLLVACTQADGEAALSGLDAAQDRDETIHAYGRIVSFEDGPYPMATLTIEFPERRQMQTFSLNLADVPVDQADIACAEGRYADFDYTGALVADLAVLTLDGRSLLDGPDPGQVEGLHSITGTLSGVQEVTGSDLPGTVTVTAADGTVVDFPMFVSPEMVPANGKTVTATYTLEGEHAIVRIDLK